MVFAFIGAVAGGQFLNAGVLWLFGIHRSMRLNLRGFTQKNQRDGLTMFSI